MKYDVSVVGLYILDVLGRPIAHIPEAGNVEFIDQIRLTVAGTAGGSAVDCAKLGMKTLAVGAVGNDEKADFVIHTLAKFGVDTSLMQRLDAVPTSSTILCIRPNGDRPALHQRGASGYFSIPETSYPQIFDAEFLHMGGTGLLDAMDGQPTLTLLQKAKAHQCTTSFDLIAPGPGTIALVEPLLPYIDYFIPSIEEARLLSGLFALEDVAHFFLDRGAKTCVFTMGAAGSFVADGVTSFHVPAYDVAVVDTTGCGDAYSAGFLAALHHGFDPEAAARFATAASGLVATGLGSDAGIVSFDHTWESMRQLKPKLPR